MKRFLSFLCWIIGEGLLLVAIMHFGENTTKDLLILNGIVSSIIYSTILLNVFFPRLGQHHLSLKRADKLGTRWFFTLTYTALSLAAIFYFEWVNPVDLLTQIIIQLIILSVLLFGLWGTIKPAKKNEVPDLKIQKMERNQLIMINNVIGLARIKAEKRPDIPANVLNGIRELQENARVLAPGNESIALRMEGQIMVEVNELHRSLKDERIDLRNVQYTIKNCSKIFSEHKRIYSPA